MNLVATGLAMADVSQASRWREEDIKQRNMENVRRDIDEKVEQLRSISSLAALIAGFDIIVLIELDIPQGTPEYLLALLGCSTALTVCLMSLAFVTCTLMLVGILKAFEMNHNRQQKFRDFWILRCEDDWRRSFKYFTIGVPCFMSNLAIAAWVKFLRYKIVASLITLICLVGIAIWYFTHRKWGSYLAEKSTVSRPRHLSPRGQTFHSSSNEHGSEYSNGPNTPSISMTALENGLAQRFVSASSREDNFDGLEQGLRTREMENQREDDEDGSRNRITVV